MNSPELSLVHIGTVIEDDGLTLGQLCRACGAPADWIISLVEESIIEPHGHEIRTWRFSNISLIRARSALRLQHDLGVNLPGIALVLDLREELERLRTSVN